MCMVAWPGKLAHQSVVRQQYIHAVDIVPTIYELLKIEPPEVLKGFRQSRIEGESFAASLTDLSAPGRDTQFYAMLGQRSLYHKGWLACSVHPPLAGWGRFDRDVWELYHLEGDRSQSRNVAAERPEQLEQLKQLWFYYAGLFNGLPIDDRSALEQVLADRPRAGPERSRYEYYPNCADVPELAGVAVNGRSYTISAGVELDSIEAEGVLYAHGGVAGGHSLYLKDRRLHYAFNWIGSHLQTVIADDEITTGRHVMAAEFALSGPSQDPERPGFTGSLTLYVDDRRVGAGDIVTQPGYFCVVGDGICVGRDSGSPVTSDYAPPFRFRGGTIDKVVVDVAGDRYVDHDAQVRAWFWKD